MRKLKIIKIGDHSSDKTKYKCDCGWVGNTDEMDREMDFEYDQSCCPECNDVMIDLLHGIVYVKTLRENNIDDILL